MPNVCVVRRLNERAIRLLDGLICFKQNILPLLADHVLREANHYIRLLKE